MIIRSEQITVFQSAAEDEFESDLCSHLRENYAESLVRLPEEEYLVKDLPDETLHRLVGVGIGRARSYGLTFESSIAAYTALMFEAAPNFDKHRLSNLCLKDQNIDPNDRLDEILKAFSDKHWERIKSDYDVDAWEPVEEIEEDEEIVEDAAAAGAGPDAAKQVVAETMPNVDDSQAPKPSKSVPDQASNDDLDFGETAVNIEDEDDIDLDETIVSMDFPETK